MKKIFFIPIVLMMAACTSAPKQPTAELSSATSPQDCTVSFFQDGVRVNGSSPLPGIAMISLQKKPFIIQVPSANCNASIGVFNNFENMRSLGGAKTQIFTTSGFEMAASPNTTNTLPLARDGERVSKSDLNGFFGQQGMNNYQSVCKAEGVCPVALMAFRSYHNFTNAQSGQPTHQAQITVHNFQPINLMVYTEIKRFPREGAQGKNWPADILLKPNPYLVVFSK